LDNKTYIKQLIILSKDPIYKVIVLLFIGYVGYINFVLAIYLILAYAMTLDTVTKYEISEQLKIKIINNQNKREIKLDLSKSVSSKSVSSAKSVSSKSVSNTKSVSAKSTGFDTFNTQINEYDQNELFNELVAQY
jgi:hypothetical protein